MKNKRLLQHLPESSKTLIGYLSLGLILLGIKYLVIYKFGSATPHYDEWKFSAADLFIPVLEGKYRFLSLFLPHNGHRILTYRVVSLALLYLNGIWNPLLMMLFSSLVYVIAILLYLHLVKPNFSPQHLVPLLGFTLVVFGIPYAWDNILISCQVGLYAGILYGYLSVWLMVNASSLGRRWWLGLLVGVLAYYSFLSGIMGVAAVLFISILKFATVRKKSLKDLLALLILAVVLALMVQGIPVIENFAKYKTTGIDQFFLGLERILSWPFQRGIFFVVLCNLPAILYVIRFIRNGFRPEPGTYFLLGLLAWSFGNPIMIAYGRANSVVATRYLDYYSFDLLNNFICLLVLLRSPLRPQKFARIAGAAAFVWAMMVLFALVKGNVDSLQQQLENKRDKSVAREKTVRNYVYYEDISYMEGKSNWEIPYWDYRELAQILDSPTLRNILSSTIRPRIPCTFPDLSPADDQAPPYDPGLYAPFGRSAGTYGVSSAVAIQLECTSNARKGIVGIPVAGDLGTDGISLEIIQEGKPVMIYPARIGGGGWQIVYAVLSDAPFSIRLSDPSPDRWIAIGEPYNLGNLDPLVYLIMRHWYILVLAGCILAFFAVFGRSPKNQG